MKVRNGFVSNSSSSSFIASAIELNIEDITKDMLSSQIIAVGKDLCEGTDIISINDIFKLKFFKIFNEYEFEFYEIISSELEFYGSDEERDLILKKSEWKPNYVELDLEMDHSPSSSLETLFERYFEKYSNIDIENIDLEKYLDRLYRERKLKRILK